MVELSYGLGYNVLVSFSRGPFRVVVGPVVSYVRRVVVVSLPEVSEVVVLDVVDPSEGLMSEVTGGLVLVTVSVLVVADDDLYELDALGSSGKYNGA
jgi:hypothetical protein